ncbi:lipoprotein [Turneriella parva]|uniref:Uncharacterized protein n=1 Tax=Turneriella parva (strain ATCC BAA-1111 / DSM 21527 / NCTC 11395 / H) TaxID=869212 RepID=I4B3Y1_TURPD|nr:lipoprotein [Turneriella parva]AFM11988.1 hypothetical protein Turpa_1340 [Turneriella parva DSM 21527]
MKRIFFALCATAALAAINPEGRKITKDQYKLLKKKGEMYILETNSAKTYIGALVKHRGEGIKVVHVLGTNIIPLSDKKKTTPCTKELCVK